jgi:hypothetical protein
VVRLTGIDLAQRISRLHDMLDLVAAESRDQPLRVSLARVRSILPS